jgi:hypothetical protein
MIVLLQSVVFCFDAFSSREPVSTSLENALKPLAGVGVTDGQHEEAEAHGQHDDVQHECSFVCSGRFCRALRAKVCEPRQAAVDRSGLELQPAP